MQLGCQQVKNMGLVGWFGIMRVKPFCGLQILLKVRECQFYGNRRLLVDSCTIDQDYFGINLLIKVESDALEVIKLHNREDILLVEIESSFLLEILLMLFLLEILLM